MTKKGSPGRVAGREHPRNAYIKGMGMATRRRRENLASSSRVEQAKIPNHPPLGGFARPHPFRKTSPYIPINNVPLNRGGGFLARLGCSSGNVLHRKHGVCEDDTNETSFRCPYENKTAQYDIHMTTYNSRLHAWMERDARPDVLGQNVTG